MGNKDRPRKSNSLLSIVSSCRIADLPLSTNVNCHPSCKSSSGKEKKPRCRNILEGAEERRAGEFEFIGRRKAEGGRLSVYRGGRVRGGRWVERRNGWVERGEYVLVSESRSKI